MPYSSLGDGPVPGRALIIVDFQNDFTPGGALAVPDGDQISQRINELAAMSEYDLVVATRDWHPPDHGSFERHGGPWPPHCVAGTPGAELHPALARECIDVVIDKGQDRDTEGYSAFDGTHLERILRDRGIDEVTICGLATDYCVKNTALDARRTGFGVEQQRAGGARRRRTRSRDGFEQLAAHLQRPQAGAHADDRADEKVRENRRPSGLPGRPLRTTVRAFCVRGRTAG